MSRLRVPSGQPRASGLSHACWRLVKLGLGRVLLRFLLLQVWLLALSDSEILD